MYIYAMYMSEWGGVMIKLSGLSLLSVTLSVLVLF